ncbi:NAD(P)H-dependent oxidoreductase [Variovorax sp.]|uniref:glutathione-regulated potassium-efflux system oxidoreductase KefF n=1 Tax=Variovorax sp. TaxID=1871043 RepID=UPI002D42B194|nr:NAD(P)H-dependent oxidoreductase [Variovorax sp.]HYP83418.1 NAD(P)H-dependent oxidoreductase [Variovorax sp.]
MPSNHDAPAAPVAARSIYLIAAHPRWRESHVNRRLLEVARQAPGVDVNDLYTTYPDYVIDVEAEQARLAQADLLVLMHPIQWYSMPPLQKLWLDEVLAYGWAYGADGSALRGKDFWLAASTGGPESSYHPQGYNRYFFDAFLPAYEQTAALCGMRFLPPLMLHGARTATPAQVEAHAEVFDHRLRSYPDWPEMDEIEPCPRCIVPQSDRPVDHDEAAAAPAEAAPLAQES